MTQPTPSRRVSDGRWRLLDAALAAADRGWHVFPLRPGEKAPALHGEATCRRTGDCAAGHRKWEQRATLDPDRIRTAFSGALFNVGIATGPSGLLVIDLDRPKSKSGSDTPDGVETFQALCERAGQPVPHTFTVRTASGTGRSPGPPAPWAGSSPPETCPARWSKRLLSRRASRPDCPSASAHRSSPAP